MGLSFPADQFGNAVPLLPVRYGASVDTAITTASTAAIKIAAADDASIIRIFAIGCDVYYETGPSGVGAAGLADGLVLNGTYMEIPLLGHTHIRFAAKTGSGTARFEVLG